MAFNLAGKNGALMNPQDILNAHLANAKAEISKRADTGPSYSNGLPVKAEGKEFAGIGGAGEFYQAARDPENFAHFGDFLGRIEKFDAFQSGSGDFA
jgi:hypothetical protein